MSVDDGYTVILHIDGPDAPDFARTLVCDAMNQNALDDIVSDETGTVYVAAGPGWPNIDVGAFEDEPGWEHHGYTRSPS